MAKLTRQCDSSNSLSPALLSDYLLFAKQVCALKETVLNKEITVHRVVSIAHKFSVPVDDYSIFIETEILFTFYLQNTRADKKAKLYFRSTSSANISFPKSLLNMFVSRFDSFCLLIVICASFIRKQWKCYL